MGHVMCPVTLPLVVAGDGGGCLKLRALAGRSLSVFLSLSIQAVAYLPVEYSSGARNGDRYGKEAENVQRTWLCELFCFPFCFSDRPPKIFLPRRFYPEGTSHLSNQQDTSSAFEEEPPQREGQRSRDTSPEQSSKSKHQGF